MLVNLFSPLTASNVPSALQEMSPQEKPDAFDITRKVSIKQFATVATNSCSGDHWLSVPLNSNGSETCSLGELRDSEIILPDDCPIVVVRYLCGNAFILINSLTSIKLDLLLSKTCCNTIHGSHAWA